MIEAGLFRGDVGDVRVIGRAPVGRRHSLLNAADRQSEQTIDRTHPLGIAPGQIVVEGQDVRAAIGEGIERRRHHRRQRLPFSSQHLHDIPVVERERRDDLLVEGTLPERAARRLADQREERRPKRLARLAAAGPGVERPAATEELLVREPATLTLEGGDGGERRLIALEIQANRRALEPLHGVLPAWRPI